MSKQSTLRNVDATLLICSVSKELFYLICMKTIYILLMYILMDAKQLEKEEAEYTYRNAAMQ